MRIFAPDKNSNGAEYLIIQRHWFQIEPIRFYSDYQQGFYRIGLSEELPAN